MNVFPPSLLYNINFTSPSLLSNCYFFSFSFFFFPENHKFFLYFFVLFLYHLIFQQIARLHCEIKLNFFFCFCLSNARRFFFFFFVIVWKYRSSVRAWMWGNNKKKNERKDSLNGKNLPGKKEWASEYYYTASLSK